MAHLTNPPGYGDNSWDESTWAAAMASQLTRFRVADANAWKPSVATGVDRTVQVAVGSAWGCGVWDKTSAVELVAFDSNGGATDRFDLLVARWSWSLRSVVFDVIKGTTVPPAINTSATVVDSAKVNRIPGTRYDGVIGVVRVRPSVGAFAGTDLFDVRVWSGRSGPLAVLQSSYLAWVDGQTGDELAIVGTSLWYRHDGTSFQRSDEGRLIARTFVPPASIIPAPGGPNPSFRESGVNDAAAIEPFRTYGPTRVFVKGEFRCGPIVFGTGVAIPSLKLDGAVIDTGVQRVNDSMISIEGWADLASAGLHYPAGRVDSLDGDVGWTNLKMFITVGVAE